MSNNFGHLYWQPDLTRPQLFIDEDGAEETLREVSWY